MFLVKFFKGLKNSKKPQKNYNLEVSHEEKEVKDVDIHILPHSLSNDSIKTNEKANEIAINHVLPSEEPKKILIKNKAISAIDVNNMEKCRNIKKKKLSIQPLKVKFQEKNGQKTLSIAKNNVKSYENHVEISKDNSIFDKIDKILAKSTAYNAKNKKNYEKDLITIYSKNKVIHTIKGKDEKIIKKPMYFQKIFGNKNRKNKVKTRVIEEKKRNKSSIHANNLSVENYADENSVRYEANSLQEIKNLNISEIKQVIYNFIYIVFI